MPIALQDVQTDRLRLQTDASLKLSNVPEAQLGLQGLMAEAVKSGYSPFEAFVLAKELLYCRLHMLASSLADEAVDAFSAQVCERDGVWRAHEDTLTQLRAESPHLVDELTSRFGPLVASLLDQTVCTTQVLGCTGPRVERTTPPA